MANGDAPRGEGPRFQPEFSPGERLAKIEALLDGASRTAENLSDELDQRLKSAQALQDEKLAGLRAEHQAALLAQREAIQKVETATDRRQEVVTAQTAS